MTTNSDNNNKIIMQQQTDLEAEIHHDLDGHASLEEQWAKLNNSNNETKPSTKHPLLKKKSSGQVLLEGYVKDESSALEVQRTKSLTDEDLDELKGCVDLGFGFSYNEIPELCNTLPALELCYSMSQKFNRSCSGVDDGSASESSSETESSSSGSSPIASWKISSPGDHPEDVKARLKYWAQAVACTVKLCSY